MAKQLTSIETANKPRVREVINAIAARFEREDRARSIAIAGFVFGTIVILLYGPFSQPEGGDSAGYDYIAQSILRWQVPYRDVIDIKTPGSMYLSALAMSAGKMVGLRDVIAVRLFQMLLFSSLLLVIFFVARVYLRSTSAALIALVFPLLSSKFAEWTVGGTQPKLPMIVFGMMSLLLIARDRPFWAGIFSMLSFLCWQPGLMFTGVAFLVFSKYLTTWRDGRAFRVAIGAIIPLALVCAYFYWRGALTDLWDWTITFNYSVFRTETQREPVRALAHLWSVTRRIFGIDVLLVLLSVIGFVMFGIDRLRARLGNPSQSDLFRVALMIPPVVYFAFCIVNLQSGPDLIPFFPFIGIFAAWFLVRLGRYFSSIHMSRTKSLKLRWHLIVPGTALVVMLLFALGRGWGYRIPPGFTLQDQDRQFSVLSELLGPDDKVYVHGSVELLVVLNRPNLNPYTFLNQGIDTFASARKSVEFKSILDEMESQRPKLVALSRLKTVSSRDLLESWVSEHYDKLESFNYGDVYVRRER